jgi:alkanesulfonate monooxygenase SsuD/methylene tetrahydromethanopterin reductase-like flavin-dependent oxidoreductase (luciferase family)
MAGPRTIGEHVVPTLTRAAHEAGRAAPRVVAGMHVLLTNDPAAARERVARAIAKYRMMPSYRTLIEREGSDAPDALALIGDEQTLDAGLARLRDAGATDFEAAVVRADEEDTERTLGWLASRCDGGDA